MRTMSSYACDCCGFTCRDKNEMLAHEAAHFDLTVEIYLQWQALQKAMIDASYRVSVCCNEKTRDAYDKAIQDILDFEQKHHIETPRFPFRQTNFCVGV